MNPVGSISSLIFVIILSGCSTSSFTFSDEGGDKNILYGTNIPYASEAIYFLLTDRYVDGDVANNHVDQGGKYHTFNRPLIGPDGQEANVGYMGGDFKGVLNNADHIKSMGFTSIWLTPIFDNPDEAFRGGEEVTFGAYYKDGGKTGYHGYWGVNFYEVDEHLESDGLTFSDFTRELKSEHGLKVVLDIVANHGSPSYTMPENQPKFGKIYDNEGRLIADHQNIHPKDLNPENNPLHAFYNTHTGLAQLSDINENNPDVLNYFEGAYLKWINQGAHALRVDTIKEMPHKFWKKLFDRIRYHYPDIFIFGESYSYDAEFIAEHTRHENGSVSVLDFPGRKKIVEVFEDPKSDYSNILSYLHLDDGVYENPYELMIFYDNHDMRRMNATNEGFINANNWLFTSRGIPVIYYGSEMNFMTGKAEHEGNRNYLGQERIDDSKNHIVFKNLKNISNVRKNSIALQKGLQINIEFKENKAVFYRVYQDEEVSQTALVLLNKGSASEIFKVGDIPAKGLWMDALSNETYIVNEHKNIIEIPVKKNGVKVLIYDGSITNHKFIKAIKKHHHHLHGN